jgi:hypothetical protein
MQPLRPSIWSHDSNETASRKPGALHFAKSLKPIVYNRSGNYLSYGAKLVPAHDKIPSCDRLNGFLQIYGK